MPQYLLLTSFLLISHLTAHGRASRLVTHTITDNDLRHHCDFESNGYRYDLCPLMEKTMLVGGTGTEDDDRGEGSSTGRRFYEVALGGLASPPRARVLPKSGKSECDADTWVCLLDMTYAAHESSLNVDSENVQRPAFVIPIARKVRRSRKKCSLKVMISTDIGDDNENPVQLPLRLSLHGGRRDEKAQSAEIAFICAERESLKFLGEESGIHSFKWATPHGCPTPVPRSTHPDISIAEEQDSGSENEEPPPEEKADGDDDLLPPSKSKTRRWIAIIIVVSVIGLVGGSILISSRVRHLASDNIKGFAYTVVPLLSHATTTLRPIGNSITNLTSKSIGRLARFRQGDSQLVRWAQEDMSLTDSEDVMVNGSGAFDRYDSQGEGWDANGLDEYIPLTISPKYGKGRRVKSYGATPDVETFEERGIMTGLTKYFHK